MGIFIWSSAIFEQFLVKKKKKKKHEGIFFRHNLSNSKMY